MHGAVNAHGIPSGSSSLANAKACRQRGSPMPSHWGCRLTGRFPGQSSSTKAQSKIRWGVAHTGVFVVISFFSADAFISQWLALAGEWNGLGTVDDPDTASMTSAQAL